MKNVSRIESTTEDRAPNKFPLKDRSLFAFAFIINIWEGNTSWDSSERITHSFSECIHKLATFEGEIS